MRQKTIIGLGAAALLVMVIGLLTRPSLEPGEQSTSPALTQRPADKVESTGATDNAQAAFTTTAAPPQATASDTPQAPPPASGPAELDLWQTDALNPDTTWEGVAAKRLHTQPGFLNQLTVGQTLKLRIPQRSVTLEAKLESTSNASARVHAWKGTILHGHPQDNILIHKGPLETHITMATHEGTYSAIIENATGDTVLIDEGDITINQIPFEDGIPIAPVEQNPPPVDPES